MRGYGTRLVWNSARSTLSEPSNRRDAVMDETTIDIFSEEVHKELNALTLSDQSVQVLIVWSFNSEISSANVVDCLIVNHETAVRVLQCGVCREDRVVRLHYRSSNLRCRVHAEFELALLAIIHRQALHQQGTKARASTAAKGVEDKEALKTTAVVCHASNLVKNLINELLANSVVSTSIVVGCILFSCDHLFGMEEASVCASADLIDNIGLEIAVDGSGDIFAIA